MSDLIPNTPIANEGYERQKALVLEILLELSKSSDFIGQSMANKATVIKWELNRRILLTGYGDREGHLPAGSTPMAIMSQEEIYDYISYESTSYQIEEIQSKYQWFSREEIVSALTEIEKFIAFSTTIPDIKAQIAIDVLRKNHSVEELDDAMRYRMRDVILEVMSQETTILTPNEEIQEN